MSKKKFPAGSVPVTVGTAALYLFSGILFALYPISKYKPFLLSAIMLAVPPLVISILFIMRKERTLKKKEEKEKPEKLTVRILFALGGFFAVIGRFFKFVYIRYRRVIKLLLLATVLVSAHVFFIAFFRGSAAHAVAIWQPLVFAVLFVVAVVIDKWCLHTETDSEFVTSQLKNIRDSLRIVYVTLALCTVATTLAALGLWDAAPYLKYVLIAVFWYMSVFMLISVASSVIKKELDTRPSLIIPIPFVKGGADSLSVVDYLEENTGITMRGLWSIRYIKQIAPVTVVLIVGFLWLSTCIVQVDPNSHAAVYRLGTLQKDVKGPGIHLVLPYPFDKVEIHDTESVQKVTIGYDSTDNSDNLWTATHGKNEYKLLLGSGDELVSINIRIEYRIKNLYKYLSSTADPKQVMVAQAYELVTDETIASDLATLLSADRDAFADNFHVALDKKLDQYDLGIETVSIVLESIHPPLEVAQVYQQIISAEIEAEQLIIMAESSAAILLAEAEESRDTAIGQQTAEHATKVAQARTEVAEFMAGVEAYNAYSDEYRYHKYLKAITEAYGKANLVIVGDGIDSSKIYFGNFAGNVN